MEDIDANIFNRRRNSCIPNDGNSICRNTQHININKIIQNIDKIKVIDIDMLLYCFKYPKNILLLIVSSVDMIKYK